MRNVVQELRSEHANMERLLAMLDTQVDAIEAAERPDYGLMQDIVRYFLDFPDQCHHPKEDVLAQKLLSIAPAQAEPLRGLADMHHELGVLNRRVVDIVDEVVNDVPLPRAEVVRVVREFIDSQRHHMKMEERHFLPLAEELLSNADLRELDAEIFSAEDPLFGPQTERRWASLRDEILRS